jgi:hypothetical protein
LRALNDDLIGREPKWFMRENTEIIPQAPAMYPAWQHAAAYLLAVGFFMAAKNGQDFVTSYHVASPRSRWQKNSFFCATLK